MCCIVPINPDLNILSIYIRTTSGSVRENDHHFQCWNPVSNSFCKFNTTVHVRDTNQIQIISLHVNHISIENCIKINLGVTIQKNSIFGVPIGNAKITRKVQFHLAAPVMKYHQKTYNSCYLSSLSSSFHCINYNRAVHALINSIEE